MTNDAHEVKPLLFHRHTQGADNT